ncbi:ATP-grasp domain-containing protein [Nocardiopsis sp. CNT-189]|uniref:ATP-grasp domain-containing protein n=1 Tax=Nocardiopsis oceanisediminis TaxID=2816862 RepID=UPI003B323648
MADPIPFLFPGDPLRPRRVDGFFADEHAAALHAGAEAFLIDHDALVRGDLREAVRGLPRGLGPVRYRGWMVPAARYAEFARALAERGCRPVVSAEDYRRAHELPGWYALFEEVTPRSVWCEADPGCAPDPGELAELVRPLRPGPGIVKDYVKSRKHEWDQACFVPDLSDTGALHRAVAELVRLQQEDLAGGVVVREFERFDGAGEARVWWIGGEPALVGPHPDTPGAAPAPDLDPVRPAVAALGHPFVTTDLARRADGAWRVVEVGDGQVSGRPEGITPDRLIGLLAAAR